MTRRDKNASGVNTPGAFPFFRFFGGSDQGKRALDPGHGEKDGLSRRQPHALWMTYAVVRVVAFLQALEAFVVLLAVIGSRPILEGQVGIVGIVPIDSGVGDVIADSRDGGLEICGPAGVLPIGLCFAEIRPGTMWIRSVRSFGDGAA